MGMAKSRTTISVSWAGLSSGFYEHHIMQLYMHSTRRCIEPGSGPTSYTNGGQGALHSHSEKRL